MDKMMFDYMAELWSIVNKTNIGKKDVFSYAAGLFLGILPIGKKDIFSWSLFIWDINPVWKKPSQPEVSFVASYCQILRIMPFSQLKWPKYPCKS